jgi:hypothetical protein
MNYLAHIDERKITHYLLSFSHPSGRDKAVFFHSLGFHLTKWQDLRAALLRHARENKVSAKKESSFGVKYVIDGPLQTPDGRNPIVRAVWFIETGENQLRFVTAYPLKRSNP